ncbi:hypothetical protein PF003_g11310 [Phytophthora fragariae]|nr:hypothetical protein PF003_g11310 [Phytophthora fragariae]
MVQAALLLYPADITGFDLDGPRYAEVTSRRGGSTHVKILPGQGGGRARLTTIAPDTVTLRQVPRAELRSGQPGMLLFRPVYGIVNGVFHHGQVISYNGRAYAVRMASGTHESGTSKQQFRPSRAQQEVHNAISAPAYIGKDDDIYMDPVRTSASTHFLAHPAVTSRLHDFQFGVCDLSVLHFPRFDLNDKLERKKAHAVNMRNFSTKVDLPHIPENPEYSDLTESLTVLHIFAKGFFDSITREFVEAAKEFCETLNDFAPWSSREVHILAFWFSNVFAAYRLAVVNDLRTGSVSRFKIQLKFSMQDAELTGFYCSRRHEVTPDKLHRVEPTQLIVLLHERTQETDRQMPSPETSSVVVTRKSLQKCRPRSRAKPVANFVSDTCRCKDARPKTRNAVFKAI